MKYVLSLVFVIFLIAHAAYSQDEAVSLIPEPKSVKPLQGNFNLSAKTAIFYEGEEGRVVAELFSEFINSNYGFKSKPRLIKLTTPGLKGIIFKFDEGVDLEAYKLFVKEGKVELSGNKAGLFYGLQTLQQLIPLEKRSILVLPAIMVEDEPRFQYRGLMLDVSRHFFSVSYVKKFLDVMSHYKLNRFHWHLTDDQGWRIEIKKYPKLQSVAAWREPVENVGNSGFIKDGRYGGYYTQEEVKEVVAYAEKRHITVIPEIEMPGHSTAALAAYPDLGCTGGPYKVPQHGGITKDVYCAGKDSTFLFLQDVLAEVIPLFPGEYIHIGGDETPKDRWSKCPRCQARIKKEDLKDEHELQSYFVQRIEKFVISQGRKIIGWDEILEGGLAPNATVMSWRGESGGIAAARQNHAVIMSPYTYLYLDYYQGYAQSEPPAFPAFLPLSQVYKYEPLSDSLTKEQHRFIKGVQGNVWGEYIRDGNHANYMTYPRALALSEIAWSPASAKDYNRFLAKLKLRLAAMEREKVNFRIPEQVNFEDLITTENSVEINLSPTVAGATVYYTLDGTTPGIRSQKYSKPLNVQLRDNIPIKVKTLVVLESGRQSGVYSATYEKKPFKTALTVNPQKKGISSKATSQKISLAKEMRISDADSSVVLPYFDLGSFASRPILGVIYEGYLLADADGIYNFIVKSDDGAVIYIDDELIVDNDGEHATVNRSGSVPLRKGFHKIRLHYFDAGGGRHLEVIAKKGSEDYPLSDRLYIN
jgi:hexosaminidase